MEISYFGNEDGFIDKTNKHGQRYSPEEKAAAVRIVRTLRAELGTDRIVELGGKISVGSKGGSYDDAMAESQLALFKTKLIKKPRPWRSLEHVELATLEWVWWLNNQSL